MTLRDWSGRIHIAGVVLMCAGLVDPLEGSVVVVVGTACVALAARLSRSGQRRLAYAGFLLVALGVGALWLVSALGGVGGESGRSWWWAAPMALYPLGWAVSLVGVLLARRERLGARSKE